VQSWNNRPMCETVTQVLTCASELGITEVVRECMLYLVQKCSTSNAVLHYSIAEKNQLPELRQSILHFIFDRFSEIAASDQFMYIPAERLRAILSDDQLCARNELEIFDVRTLFVSSTTNTTRLTTTTTTFGFCLIGLFSKDHSGSRLGLLPPKISQRTFRYCWYEIFYRPADALPVIQPAVCKH